MAQEMFKNDKQSCEVKKSIRTEVAGFVFLFDFCFF